MGLLQVAAINSAMSSLIKTITVYLYLDARTCILSSLWLHVRFNLSTLSLRLRSFIGVASHSRPPTQVFIKERLIVTRERSSGKGSSYGPGPYFLSKLCAELPVTALFPVLFGSIMYPLAGLQVS